MAKASKQFVCQACGSVATRWSGKCEACGEWNSLSEESVAGGIGGGPKHSRQTGRPLTLTSLSGEIEQAPRIASTIGELDRVTGGGVVKGSALLLGGDPGIGKSTLLLQVCASLALAGQTVTYISGEEAIAQIRLRAERLHLANAPVKLAAETNVEDILATLKNAGGQDLVVIDSIQTLWTSSIESSPGTVSQVRSSAQLMIRYAKQTGACVVLVGHVTKDGQIAGPRVVEHMVDAVLYFESDGGHQFRILRSVKNRFGPTDEIGVFEMTGRGLAEIPNPSELFLGNRDGKTAGASVFAGMEGTRPILVEIQALVTSSTLATPRRAVIGWDGGRLAMILAVLEAHCGLRLSGQDVYLNVAGGLKIIEPAADLAVAAALVSSLSGVALPADCVYFGEVSLSGGVRSVVQPAQRLKEAEKLGFQSAVVPAELGEKKGMSVNMEISTVEVLADLVASIASDRPARQDNSDDERAQEII